MLFAAIIFKLKPVNQRISPSISRVNGIHIQEALFSHPEIACIPVDLQILQDQQRITTTFLGRHDQAYKVRITIITKESSNLLNSLIILLTTQSRLQLCNTEWQVEEVEFSSSDMWTGISTWADLMNKTLGHHIRFTFATPVIVIVKGDNDSNDGYPLSFPSPINVFADLKRRWEVLDGPELPGGWEDFLNAGSCYVSDYHNLRGTMTQTPQGSQIMYSGTVAYEYRKNEPKYNNALNALAQLAFYTGVGRETVRGMGATRIIILE